MQSVRHRKALAAAAGVVAAALVLAGCAGGQEPTPSSEAAEGATKAATDGATDAQASVTLVTHDSFALSEELMAGFEADTGYDLVVVAPGDAGALVNQLILTANSPLGDAVFGIDNTFASRAVDAGVLAPYEPASAVDDFDDFGARLTAIDQGDVCLNIDREWFAAEGIAEPTGFEDLLEPTYRDLTVVTNPATSSPGLVFLLATIAHFGEDGWQQYWTGLLENGTRVADGWSDAYYVDFSGSTGAGPRPIVLSYSSSPAAEVGDDGESRTANVAATCFRQVEYAGVLAGAENPEGAKAVVDWLLSEAVQNDIPGSMYVYPVSPDAELPAEWAAHAGLVGSPLALDPELIAANRDLWLEEWLDLLG